MNFNRESFINSDTCQKIKTIQNCAEYQKKNFFFDSSLICTECSEGFYLNVSKTCSQRTIKPTNCVKYFINEDKCERCEEGYFVGENNIKCIPYPQGIPNCTSYF